MKRIKKHTPPHTPQLAEAIKAQEQKSAAKLGYFMHWTRPEDFK